MDCALNVRSLGKPVTTVNNCELMFSLTLSQDWKHQDSHQPHHHQVPTNLKSTGSQAHQLQGAKKIIFTACHSGKLKLAFTSPDIISTSTKSFLMSRIDFLVLLLLKFPQKHHLPIRQVKNRIH